MESTYTSDHQQQIDAAYDWLALEQLTHKERAEKLFEIKQLCLTHNIRRPHWWYRERNSTLWMKPNGDLMFEGLDLGGF